MEILREPEPRKADMDDLIGRRQREEEYLHMEMVVSKQRRPPIAFNAIELRIALLYLHRGMPL